MQELGQQIEFEERLLAELQSKEVCHTLVLSRSHRYNIFVSCPQSELIKQRELYEQKLIQERREKEASCGDPGSHPMSLTTSPPQSIAKQRDQIVKELQALQDKKDDSETKKVGLIGRLSLHGCADLIPWRLNSSALHTTNN